MISLLLIFFMLLSALQAIRASHLLHSAIWLAGVSALLSTFFYHLGAHLAAVIELSVGAGLVTVLFVFAIGIAGEDRSNLNLLIPRTLIWVLVAAVIFLLGWLTLPAGQHPAVQGGEQAIVTDVVSKAQTNEAPIQAVIWEQRGLDVVVQVVLIFSGVLGILGLLAETKGPLQKPVAEELAAIRDRELGILEEKTFQKETELA